MGRPGPPELSEETKQKIRNEARMQRYLTKTDRIIEVEVIGPEANGWRLDRYLAVLTESLSRTLIRKWLEQGYGQLNGKVAQATDEIKVGARISVCAPLPPNPEGYGYEPDPLTILFAGDGFLVVNKPPGQLVHQAGKVLHGTLLNQLQDRHAEAGHDPREVRLVNRIDRDTSGIVLVGFDEEIHAALSKALEQRDVKKSYIALCHGIPEAEHGHWRQAIGPHPDGSMRRIVRDDGQACHTEYQVSETANNCSQLAIQLHTGRQHQIRVHAAFNGHPLVGDWMYGAPCEEMHGQALHAHQLRFTHPRSGEALHFVAPLPAATQALWDAICAGTAPTARAHNQEELERMRQDPGRQRRLPDWLDDEERQQVRKEFDGE